MQNLFLLNTKEKTFMHRNIHSFSKFLFKSLIPPHFSVLGQLAINREQRTEIVKIMDRTLCRLPKAFWNGCLLNQILEHFPEFITYMVQSNGLFITVIFLLFCFQVPFFCLVNICVYSCSYNTECMVRTYLRNTSW